MRQRYHINVRRADGRYQRRLIIVLALIFILLILAGWIYLHYFIHGKTTIKQSKGVTTSYVSSTATSYKTYKASDFSFQMSTGWKVVPVENNEDYEWQDGTGQNYETVQIFEDDIPTNFAVNHIIIVAANGSQISVSGAPSDNCANFTNGHPTSTQVGYPAKWQGVEFNCDLNNENRDTVGTTSAQSINSVTLVSPTDVHRSFFFLYTDSSLQPNYADFEKLLTSFQLQ